MRCFVSCSATGDAVYMIRGSKLYLFKNENSSFSEFTKQMEEYLDKEHDVICALYTGLTVGVLDYLHRDGYNVDFRSASSMFSAH